MKITFLGTSAATACPLPFCKCNFCETARIRGGKDFRKRSSLLLNDDLLIDFGPDVMSSSFVHGVSIVDIKFLLQTHSHADHFDPSAFGTRFSGYAVKKVPMLELYGSDLTLRKLSEMLRGDGHIRDLYDKKEQNELKLKVFSLVHFQSLDIGRYNVISFPANHDDEVDSLIYAISEKKCNIFYGVDTGELSEEIWNYFYEKDLKFDIIILDHTYGPNIEGDSHLSADIFISYVERMKKNGILNAKARIFATHISHEGNYNHKELSKYSERHGYEIAYDGLVINIDN
ncbi:hypothetical protein MNBD_ALPHA09-2278 [hydrothermal vent metagenome]|uniref:Metallo-beta-lactamase domain-containing protein n=1 Tax=hydrothermal vent metagenome TaxID=652676 RepID=A0A3B0T391_9ZZZZ